MRPLSTVGVACVLSLCASWAQAQSAFPPFTGESVTVRGTEDVYDPVRAAIADATKKSPRRYYVVVLGSTGDWNQQPQQMLQALFEQWVRDTQGKDEGFDAANSALILLGLEQHDIVVRTGQNLQREYGLDQTAMQNDLVPNEFVPAARDGDIAAGLVRLIAGMEGRVKATEVRAAQQQAAAEARERMWKRNLPIAAGATIVIAIAAGAGIYIWRHSRRLSRFGKAFAAFNGKLVELMERCDAIKQQHQLLPFSDKDFTEPMTGATAALYAGIEERLASLRETWLDLMEVRNQIERLAATAGFFENGKRKEAENLLAEKAKLPEVEDLYQKCRQDLETLGQAHESATAAWDGANKSTAALPEKIVALGAAGLTARPYDEQREAIEKQLSALKETLTADPIGVRQGIAAIQERLAQLAAAIARLLELDADWRNTGARREEIVAQVAAERAAGLKLDETNANPDKPLGAAELRLHDARQALLAEQVDATAQTTAAAQKALDAAQQLVVDVRAAREFCRQQSPSVEGAIAETRTRQPQADEQLRALERDFAADSWNNVAANATLAAEKLQSAAAAWRDAGDFATDERQAYIAAAARLKQAAAENAEAQTLLAAIGERLSALNALREQCAQQRGELLDAARQLQTFLGQHAETVDQEARSRLAEASQLEEQVVEGLDSPRPHWPAVKQRLDQLATALAAAREAAEADVRSRSALEATLQEAESLAARVANTLRSHTADRPRANQSHRRGAAAIAELRNQRGNWKSLLASATEAKQDLANAERWATEDIQLASQAAQAITAAERAVGAARSFVSLGISADSALAAGSLAEANRQFTAQQYEQAIATAASAEQQARQAVQAAEQAATMRRMQQEAERRRREAQRGGVGPVVIPTLPTFNFGGGHNSSPIPTPQTASANWSTGGAAHGNWSGGASHNKW